MKISKIIFLSLIVAAIEIGIYFKDDVFKFFNIFNKQIQDFQKTQIGQTISKMGEEMLAPPPLKIGGAKNNVILLKSKIIEETNFQRQENENLPKLAENEKLDEAAAAKANDMFKNQYFEHTSPLGLAPGELVKNYGYDYILAGENLILGNFLSEKEVVDNWMASPGHRANILNAKFSEIGVAVVKGVYKGETVWIGVQEFGVPLSVCDEPNESLKNQIVSEKSDLEQLSLQITAKKNEIFNTNSMSPGRNQMIDDYNQMVEQYNLLAESAKENVIEYNKEVNNFNNCVQENKTPQ